MLFLFPQIRFCLMVVLTIGLIYVTSPSVSQNSVDSANSQPNSTSISKDSTNLFHYLPYFPNFIKRPATKWIWLDGRRIFQVTASEDYLPERAQTIETNFQQISNAYFTSKRHGLKVDVVPINGSPTIEIDGRYLLTVTELDAKLLDISAATRAKQLSQILQQTLIRAKQERQPQYLKRQSAIAIGIVLAVVIIYWAIAKLRRRIYSTKNNFSAEISASKYYTNSFIVIEERLLFCCQILVWLGGIILCLRLFPYTRPLQVWLLSGMKIPFKIGLVILGTYLAIRFSHNLIDRLVSSIKIDPLLSPISSERVQLRIITVSSAIQWITIIAWLILGLIVSLVIFGVDIAPLIAGAGLLGVAVSLASQNLIKDAINGFLIVLEDQYGIGDCIDTGTWSGIVEGLNLRITQLRNPEGKLITIPNSQIGAVANLTKSWSRVDLNVPIDYNTDTLKAIEIIETTAKEMSQDRQWQWQILETKIMGVDDFSERGLIIKIWIKTRPLKQWNVAREYRLRLKLAFDRAGISIAVPQQDVSVRQKSG